MIDIKYFDQAVMLMDEDIREDLHAKIAPCSNEEFLRAYEKAHFEKYNEVFTI